MGRTNPILRIDWLAGGLALLAGCTAPVPHREVPLDHPASASAPGSAAQPVANPFAQLPTFKRPREGAPVEAMPGHGMPGHGMPGHGSELAPGTHPGANEAAPTPSEPSQAPLQYTCPMHPEVVQDAPGECPKCGMTLEPVEPPSHDHGGHKP